MTMTIGEITAQLEQWFPRSLAESWDNVGLLLGDATQPATRVMTCLTVTGESAREAIERRVDLIVSHHPILFRPINRLVAGGDSGAIYDLARAGAAVYSPHTAFDSAEQGINQQIAGRLHLSDVRPLRPAEANAACKVVVFVPESELEAVQGAMFSAGGGRIGEYSECSFRVTGAGSFRGSERSNPTIGERGRREEVAEYRLEVLVPKQRLSAVLDAMVSAHSYEEPAYDVYPLQPLPSRLGAGRVGRLPRPTPLRELAHLVREALGGAGYSFVGREDQLCESVGIGCGAGADFFADAIKQGCHAFITGEARFHQQLEARNAGLGVVLAGHYATERFAVETLAQRIATQWPSLEVWASQFESDPPTPL